MTYYNVYTQAKDMITLVNQFAANIEEKKGSVTDDEVNYNTALNHGCYMLLM